MYVELHARSAFSFLEGASLPEQLALRCAEVQMPAFGLLDRDGWRIGHVTPWSGRLLAGVCRVLRGRAERAAFYAPPARFSGAFVRAGGSSSR